MQRMLGIFQERYRVDHETGCWIWIGAKRECGGGIWYGVYNHIYAHRIAYELFKGSIPEGFVVDHRCSFGLCVNPDHLDAVSQTENVRRTVERGRNSARTRPTHCPRGHPYAGDNLYLRHGKHASCRTCQRDAMRRLRAKRRQPPKPHYNARKTHCKFGHEFTPENTHMLKHGERLCRICHNERSRLNRERKKLALTYTGPS